MRAMIHPDQLRGHQVAVVGAGRSGMAAARLLRALGAEVRVHDTRSESLAEAAAEEFSVSVGEHRAEDFAHCQMVVLSPGIPRARIAPLVPPGTTLIGELELGSWFVSEPMVAVTGSNGKTTTTSVIGHVLKSTGRRVFVGGNIGTPLCEYVLSGDQADVVVLEVSSFQLQTVSAFHPRVGVLLNISPNHLDYHADMDEYRAAKMQLFARMTAADLAVLPLGLKEEVERGGWIRARRVYVTAVQRFVCPGLPGAHNQANVEAAWHACRFFGVDEAAFAAAVKDFQGLPHRQEVVLEKDGVCFVDDSKATTLDALAAALTAQERPVRLLAGGVFKGGDPAALAPLIRERCRSIHLFGQSREVFTAAWKHLGLPLSWHPTLEEAVVEAAKMATSGETVLLSPATASFDLFANYKERGQTFAAAARRAMGVEG
ncbi:MAG: UDP-N-acetylmuramoylalanine--D-glutamate ligase [Desulfomicrobiaceae bacterium]|nr:UDP-N-acetylmuramoylalanine--D-glutamate ligase [Desulfomicrobiaceae bacterium]